MWKRMLTIASLKSFAEFSEKARKKHWKWNEVNSLRCGERNQMLCIREASTVCLIGEIQFQFISFVPFVRSFAWCDQHQKCVSAWLRQLSWLCYLLIAFSFFLSEYYSSTRIRHTYDGNHGDNVDHYYVSLDSKTYTHRVSIYIVTPSHAVFVY